LLNIDSDQISIAIDLDQGARLASVQWRDMQFVVPFRGQDLTWGWFAMAPFAGRVKNGVVRDLKGSEYQLPTNFDPPHALNGQAVLSSWEDLGGGRQFLELPSLYDGATVTQSYEILDNAIRWSLEYEANGCQLPVTLGFHPWFAREIGKGDSELISPSTPPWDDTFVEVLGTPEIIWPGAAKVTVESDTPYWHIYDQDEDGICIEPVTAPPDSQNLKIQGESYIECLITFNEDF
jgi:aldose 1-epimerase